MRTPSKRAIFNVMAKMLPFGRDPIFIVGHGRSGTTWIGNVLAQAPGVLYYHEPCQPKIRYGGSFGTWFKYVRPGQRDAELEAYLDPVFRGLIPEWGGQPWPMGRSLRRFLPGFRVVIKEVASLMSLQWVCERYEPRVLVVVRHPCGVALSELRKNTPGPESVEEILGQRPLLENHLESYTSVLKGAEKPFEIYGAIWGARHRVLVDQMAAHPEWAVLKYEDVCADPPRSFAGLFRAFGLRWTSRVEDFLQETTTRNSPGRYSVHRLTSQKANSWKREMNTAEIQQVQSFVKPFGLPFYASPSDWS